MDSDFVKFFVVLAESMANMCPAYRPQNDWVAGFAVVELDADGYYRVDNRKIIDGRIV